MNLTLFFILSKRVPLFLLERTPPLLLSSILPPRYVNSIFLSFVLPLDSTQFSSSHPSIHPYSSMMFAFILDGYRYRVLTVSLQVAAPDVLDLDFASPPPPQENANINDNTKSSSNTNMSVILGASIGGTAVALFTVGAAVIIRRRRRTTSQVKPFEFAGSPAMQDLKLFTQPRSDV